MAVQFIVFCRMHLLCSVEYSFIWFLWTLEFHMRYQFLLIFNKIVSSMYRNIILIK